jgi:hypothetical protein
LLMRVAASHPLSVRRLSTVEAFCGLATAIKIACAWSGAGCGQLPTGRFFALVEPDDFDGVDELEPIFIESYRPPSSDKFCW